MRKLRIGRMMHRRSQLPGNFSGRKLRKVIKDSVRLGTEVGTVEPKASGQRAVVEDLLMPMSLTAYLEEV